jgi:hypothetical protein
MRFVHHFFDSHLHPSWGERRWRRKHAGAVRKQHKLRRPQCCEEGPGGKVCVHAALQAIGEPACCEPVWQLRVAVHLNADSQTKDQSTCNAKRVPAKDRWETLGVWSLHALGVPRSKWTLTAPGPAFLGMFRRSIRVQCIAASSVSSVFSM